MVFASVVVDILNRYLRPYVKKLDPSQIKVGVWKGHAKLEKLELKEDLFAEADLDVPVQIRNSYIGKLELKIPWKNLTKEPLLVTIDEVYVVVGPKIDTHYDPDKELKRRRKEKEKRIEKFTEAAKKRKKKEKEAKKGKKSKKDKDKDKDKPDTFVEKLIVHLLKNMEVKVRDIHVRYEDSSPSRRGTLAAGVTLHSLELKSTDENWLPCVVKESATIIFKLLELNCLGLYWNTYTTKMADLPQLQMADEMREAIARPVLAPPPTIEYLLKPVSATARLKLNLKPGTDMNIPQVAVDVNFEDIVFSLQETQFKSLLNTADTFDRHVVNQKFLKYRPKVGVRRDVKEWWRYAITAVREEEVKRKLEMWSWKHMKQHRNTVRQYQEKYREKLRSLSPSSSLLLQIQELEDQLDWFNIVICRREAKKKEKSKPKKAAVPASAASSTSKPLAPSPSQDTPPTPLTPSQKPPSTLLTPSQKPPPTVLTPSQKPPSTVTKAVSPSPEPPKVKGDQKAEKEAKKPEQKEAKKPEQKEAKKTEEKEAKKPEQKKDFFSKFKKHKTDEKSEKVSTGGAGVVSGGGDSGAGVSGEGKRETKEAEKVEEKDEEEEERERQRLYQAEQEAKKPEQKEAKKPEQKKGFFSMFRKRLKTGEKSEKVSSEGVGVGSGGGDSGAGVRGEGKREMKGAEKEKDEEEEERERQQLYQAIGYSEDEEFEEYPAEYVAHKILISLNSLTLELSGKKQLATLVTRTVTASVQNRPSSKSVSVSASVFAMEMTGIPHGPDLKPTTILSTVTPDLSTPLVNLQVELNPLLSEMDLEVRASLQPLQITYDADTVDGLIAAFRVRENIHLQELTSAATATAEDLRTQTSSGFQNALKSKKQMLLDVTLHSPYLVLPQGGYFSPDSSLLVVDLGTLSVSGSTKGSVQDQCELPEARAKSGDALSRYYDNFTLKLEGMQVMVAEPGDNWLRAMSKGSSSLHILNPTGLKLQLKQSVVKKDAYLPSIRIEGDIPGFEVEVSDQKLVTILKVVTSLQLPPPSLANTTTYYDDIPAPFIARPVSAIGMMDNLSDDTVSLASYMEGEEEEEEEDVCSLSSLSSATAAGTAMDGEAERAKTVERIFTDTEVKLVIRKVGVSLTKVEKGRTGPGSFSLRRLLDVSVEEMRADVIDRNWDTQGSVTIGNISILDHITLDSTGAPTHLLQTRGLSDGNFITSKFVNVTRVGQKFAEQYTGFKNSVSVQLSRVDLQLERRTIAALLELGMTIRPAIKMPESKATGDDMVDSVEGSASAAATPTTTPTSSVSATPTAATFNPKDFEDLQKKPKDFYFDVSFDGIALHLAHQQQNVVYTHVSGFLVKGKAEEGEIIITASMRDLLVKDPHQKARNTQIVSRTDTVGNIIQLQVIEYKRPPQKRDSRDLSWVDTSLKAEIQRLKVQLETDFLDRFLEYAQHLKIDQRALQIAAKATADTATAAATAIKEREKTAHRVKLDVTLHAPLIALPYRVKNTQGEILIDLGDFHVQNRFVYGGSLLTGPLDTVSLKDGQATFDQMEIHSTAIQIHRKSTHTHKDSQEATVSRTTILEPMQFTATVTRNLGKPIHALPNVDIQLPLDIVKFHLHEEDVKALITIALATTRVAQILSPSAMTTTPGTEPKKVKPVPSPPRPRAGSQGKRLTSALTRMDSVTEVMEVRVQASLHLISLDFETKKGPLFQALSSEMAAQVGVYKDVVNVKGSVDSLSVVDSTGDGHRKIVSLAEDTKKASSIELKVDTNPDLDPLSPLGEVKASIAQVRLVLLAPFVQQLLDFVRRLKDINSELLTNATKLGKGGAAAITTKAWDKYFRVGVSVHAPVLLLPVSEISSQAFMIDLGSLSIQNMMIQVEEDVGVDAYGITLDSFKASRVILDVESGYSVLAERVLLQPFHMQLAVERNLCFTWYKKTPLISVNCQMGEFKVAIGQEDMQQLVFLGKNFGDRLMSTLSKGGDGGKVRGAIMEGLKAEEEEGRKKEEEERGTEEVTEMVKVSSSLNSFNLKLFKEEPSLSPDNPVSIAIPDDHALASLQLLQMELSVCVQSNQEVELQASLKDVALCDEQVSQQEKKTGNRVIQHYTSNPISAYTGKLDTPIVKFSYHLREEQHIVILKTENILVLSDIEFLSTLSNYFQAILSKKEPEPLEDVSVEDSVSSGASSEYGEPVAKPARPLPKLKMEASVKNIRVAIVEDAEEPQALTLKLSTAYFHVQLTEKNKQASVNIADLSIAASSFFNLDQISKWILLPCSMQLTMTGPIDQPAMDINGTIEPITLTLSPSVIRLVIHAVTSLLPKKDTQNQLPPSDLWDKKKIEDQRFWFLRRVPLHRGRAETITPTLEKGEIMSLGIESVEVILESESTQRSRGYPVLAFNVNAVAQVFEWTGDLTVKADVHCEASYYNEQLSVWEPLLEPLEGKTGRLSPWCITAEVKKSSPEKLVVNGDENGTLDANFSVSLFAEAPLQLTLTKTSLELLKGLAKAYSKEYERKVESSADVHTLTGAPFIIVNKLGGTVGVFVQPGPSLKLRGKAEFAKIISEESVNLWFTKELGRRSYASLITRPGEEEHTVNLAVGIFKKLDAVVISSPGSYYYELEPKKPPTKPVRYGLVVDVAVTGNKKTVTIRSSVQFHNHLLVDIELHSALPLSRNKKERTAIIKPDESYAVPVEMAHSYEFYVVPAGFTLEPIGPPIAWFEKPGGRYADSRCKLPGDIEPCHFIRVLYEEETYKITKHLPTEDFAHHVFHLHPPLLLQNLLPFPVSVKDPCTMRIIEPGEFVHFHEISQDLEPEISISVTQPGENSLVGTLKLVKKPKQYSTFSASANGKSATVSVLTDDFGYHKVSIFSPFWMINKTGLNIEYLVDGKAIKHPSNKNIVLLSTSNPKNNIQVSAITPQGKHTDWTMRFSLNAVGTSGNFIARLGQQCYIFGVEVHLSQFTLTKIATISPYYMLVNETEIFLQVAEATTPSNRTSVPPGELVPFWPLTDDSRMVVTAGTDEKRTAFNYKKPDTVCLKFDNELKAVCVDIQESESAIITTFTPYYPGCVPVQIVNHFPDVSLQFWQDIKSPLVHTLDPGETVLYTWDNPLGRRVLRWSLVGARVKEAKPIYVTKDGQQTLQVRPGLGNSSSSFLVPAPTLTTPPPPSGFADSWLDVDESFSERLVTAEEEGSDTSGTSSFSPSPSLTPRGSLTGNIAGDSKASGLGNTTYKAYWKSFISGIQRVVLFTPHVETIDRVKASATYSQPQLELSLSLRAVGLSLVDNRNKRELAYIAAIQSGVIWQVKKSRKLWKTLNNSVIAMLEEAYQKQEIDVKVKNLVVNLATMEMFSPVKGKLRRTHHDGVYAKFTMSERDYSINAKVAYVQVDNQLPFSVYPQVLYPLPPPPTVASDTEPKPFVEASIILRKKDEQSNVQHFKYVHVLVQKMAVNADLGFLLAVVNFFSSGEPDPQLEAEYVKSDIDDSRKSLKDTIVPAIAKDLESTKSFFDVLHIAPIKIVLSFTVRSVGKNKEGEDTVGDRVLELFLHSLGAILTSVQDTEMKFSLFHLEYQMKTGRALMRTLVKHYRTQALVELYTLVLGLDVLGNPVSIVRGVVGGTIDLFYEPIKGSVLGPEEFFEGLGIGLRSFFGGTVGGITGAGAKITGAVGDVFAKLSFDEQFIDKRQQEKTRPPKMGLKLGGFAKNVFEGVTGVVTQPVKGAKKEGVAGFFKGTGKGLVGLLVRPTGGIIDLTSGTLDFVTRKTQIGNVEIQDIRPPRFIGRDGVVRPYSPNKAVGTALLHAVDEGKYVNQFYFGRVELTKKLIVLVLDRSMMLIEKKLLLEGWHSQGCIRFKHFSSPATVEDTNVILHYKPGEEKGLTNFSVRSRDLAHEVADVINQSYKIYQTEH